jgi:hypothetical protein
MTDETTQSEQPKVDGRSKEAKATKARARTDGPSEELARRRAERLSRGSLDYSNDKRLTTAGADLDFRNYQYRWANDELGNIQQMTAREWEVVSDTELNGLDTARLAGLSREGRPMNARLMKKYKPWFDEDQDAKVAEYREREKALKRGMTSKQEESPEDAGKDYVREASVRVATPTKASGGYSP